MYAQHEEMQILRGIDEIMFNLKKVPLEDFTHLLIKDDRDTAVALFNQLFTNLTDISKEKKSK